MLLDADDGHTEAWAPLRNTSSVSAAAEAMAASETDEGGRVGVITASLDIFEATAVFSTMLFFSSVESVEDTSGSEGETHMSGHARGVWVTGLGRKEACRERARRSVTGRDICPLPL